MDVFLENIKNSDQQIRAQTLENISKLLNSYVDSDKIFSYTTEDQINSFFKTDLLRFTNILINTFPKDFNNLTNREELFLLIESYLSIVNKNTFSICLPFSTLIVGLKKLENFDISFFNNLLSVDLLMNLTESFNSEPSINLLDFILLISSCVDSEEAQIDDKVMFGEISEATISLFNEADLNKCDSNVISRVFSSMANIINDFSNSESDEDNNFLDDSFTLFFFNSLIKILQCESFEKQNFAIKCFEKMLTNNANLFFKWASEVNPYIALNNIEGIDQIITEISNLIKKIAVYRIIEIDQQTLEKFITRIDSADLSQKKTYMNNFGIVASNSNEQIVLKVIENYIENHELTSNLCSFLGSCAIFTLDTKLNVSNYIIGFLEKKIPEYFDLNANDNTIVSVLKNIYIASPSDCARMKIYCENYFSNKSSKIPHYMYTLMLSIFQNLDPIEASQLLDKMIIYDETNEPLFDKLLAQVVLSCDIPLKNNQSIYILQSMTKTEEKLEILFEIMKKRETNIIDVNSWIIQTSTIIKERPINIALKFANKVLPNFYYLPYQIYCDFFVSILFILFERYINEDGEKVKEEIFECFYTHMIMCNTAIRINFLENFFDYFIKIFTQFTYSSVNATNFLYKAIIRSEYYIDPLLFDIDRHRPIKKEKGGFVLSLSRIKQGLTIHVYPTTKIRDLLFTIGLYNSYANLYDFSLKKINDQAILDNDTTLADNNINENTELELLRNSPDILVTDKPVLFSLIIRDYYSSGFNFIMNNLFSEEVAEEAFRNESYDLFLKKIWKVVKIMPTPDKVKGTMKNKDFLYNALFISKNQFKKKYYIQEIANKVKQDPSYLTFLSTNNLIEDISKLIFISDIKENIRIEVMKILINYSNSNNNDLHYFNSDDMHKIVPILTNYFIHATKIKSRKLILELLALVFISNTNDGFNTEFSSYLIENDQFFKICIFTNESLINHSLKLFVILSELQSNILFKKFVSFFDLITSENHSLIATEDYFQLLGAILPSLNSDCSNEVEEIFQKCVKKLNEYKYKWFNNIAELIFIFISKMNKELNAQSIIDLIDFVFNKCGENKCLSAFSILRNVYESSNINIPIYTNYILENLKKFKIDRWNYSPSNHKKRGKYCGLRNLGSTCYMNSILQLLENNSNFFDRIFSIENPTPLVNQIRELFAHLECSTLNYTNTENFANHWKEIEYPIFDPRIQEDAAEFLHIFLDKLPEEVEETFTGNSVNSFNGITIDFHHDIPERFYTLGIPILPDFFESMRSIVKPQMFIGNNKYMSEENGKIDVERITKITQFPRNLVIQLKRFDFNIKEGKRTKINDEFIFPMSFNTKQCFPDIDESQSFNYVLTGVITHSGTAEGGHYNSILRKIKMNENEDDEFICFNDSEVSQITEEKFWSMAKGNASSQVAAYLLFYEWNDESFKNHLSEDKKAKIDSNLQKQIIDENKKIQQIQSLFTEQMCRFIINISVPSILIKYYTHVLCHSSLTNLIKQYTTAIIQQIKVDSNSIIQNINEDYEEILDALVNSHDEISNSIVEILTYIYKIDKNIDRNFDINLMNNISSNIINHLNSSISVWRIYEKFGKIVEVICTNHLDIAIKYNYFDSIVSIILEFYNSTTGNVAIENINLSSFLNSINILIDSINSQESLDKLILIIDFYGEKIIPHQPSFKALLKNGVLKNKIPANFLSLINETTIITKENIIDLFLKCETNHDFISFLPSIKSTSSPTEFFILIYNRDHYIFSRLIERIPVFSLFIIFYSSFTSKSKYDTFRLFHTIIQQEISMAVLKDPNFNTKKNKFNQFGSDIQETISTMINLFGYSFLIYTTDENIFSYFVNVYQYSITLNTPKQEHINWYIPFFDELFKTNRYILAIDLMWLIFIHSNPESKANFLSTRIDILSKKVLNNLELEFYFDLVSSIFASLKEGFKIMPDLFMKLIEKGENLKSFLYILNNISNGNKRKNRDKFLDSLRDILTSVIEYSNEYSIKIIDLFKNSINIVFNEPKLFLLVDKLVNVMDDNTTILFIEKLFEFSKEIVLKSRIVSTLNIMIKIAHNVTQFNESQGLLNLVPSYMIFFNAPKDQIPLVLNFAKILAEKCHPIGNVLFDNIIEFAKNYNLTLSKWELYSSLLDFCYDQHRAVLIANQIIQSLTTNVDLFNDKAIIDCICKLKDFANNDENWSLKIIILMCNAHSMPNEYSVFLSSVIKMFSKEKLEELAENIADKMKVSIDVLNFIQNIKILMMIKSETNFDMKSFVDKHKNIFMNEWPADAEKYRSSFIL